VGRRSFVFAVVLAAVLAATASPAGAVAAELMPGVSYERIERVVAGKPVVIHVVTAPKPGGLYRLVPVLSNGDVTGQERVSAMQERLSSQATVVGVNGDLYNTQYGFPTGIFMRDGVLHGRPTVARSTLGIGLDGVLRIARIGFFGTWAVGESARESLDQLNRPLAGSEVGLFTRAWGGETPRRRRAVDVVLSGVPPATVNADLTGQVVEVRRGGGTPIPDQGAVLQATGSRANGLEALALPGLPFVATLILKPWWEQVADAIGGGPALVRRGKLALPTTEQFSSSQLLYRHPRTAVGQLGDGRIVLVAVDGRSSRSAGLTVRQLGEELVRLGVVTGIALDGGGGTTLAFDGAVVNTPSDGAERPVSDALMVLYYGVHAPEPERPVVSPNGDGVADGQRLAYKIVRPSVVRVRLIGPKGGVLWSDTGPKEPGVYPLEPDLGGRPEGRWRWVVSATDDEGNESDVERRFQLNNTLGFLDLSADRVKRGRPVGVDFRLDKGARLLVTVTGPRGDVVRTLLSGWRHEQAFELSWNGRTASGKPARAGRYTIAVRATNRLGVVVLSDQLVVRRS
jgi:hypothetical protein